MISADVPHKFSSAEIHPINNSENEFRLYGVLSSGIDLIWSEVLPFIIDSVAFSDGTYTADDIYKFVKEKKMQLWVVYKNPGICCCAVITEITIYPRQKRLNILFLGGVGLDKWLHKIDEIMQWGREMGCFCVQVYGRDGWVKALKDYGFKKTHIILKADL